VYSQYYGIGGREDLCLELDAILSSPISGMHESALKAFGLEFAAYRDYADGDDPGMIDVSRSEMRSDDLDDLVVRLREPERQLATYIIIDCSRGMETPRRKFHVALALAHLFARSAFQSRDPARIVCCFDHGEGGIVYSPWCRTGEALNRFFADVHDGEALMFSDSKETFVDFLGGGIPSDSYVVVISDFFRPNGIAPACMHELASSRNTRLVLTFLNELDGTGAVDGLLAIQDPLTGRTRTIDGRQGKELTRMREDMHRQQGALIEEAESLGHIAALIPVIAARPFEGLLERLGSH
jgi:Uncharacterized conserved protein (some members contain a von Willebrand factor type A (vWA) domain)